MKHLLNKAAGYQSRYPNIEVEVAGGQSNFQSAGIDAPGLGSTTLRLLSDWIYYLAVGLFSLVNSFFEVSVSLLKQTKLLPYFRFAMVMVLVYFAFYEQQESTQVIHTAYTTAAAAGDTFTPKGASAIIPVSKKPKKKLDPFATAYIERFSKVAQTEMNKFGIPASIKLAQGLLESSNGKSRLAAENFNHFGLKCFSKSCKKGHCSNHNDDTHKDFFRKYQSAWESWRDHSQFLMGARYEHLQEYNMDYKKWAKGLKKAGYATDKKYDKKLIDLIEQYDLQRFDMK